MNQAQKIMLFVEGQTDKKVVEIILSAANIPLDNIAILPVGGKGNLPKQKDPALSDFTIVVLMDLDETFTQDAIAKITKEYADTNIEVFVAIPEIESWLFADEYFLHQYVKNESAKKILEALPQPEEIEQPKALAINLFGDYAQYLNNTSSFDIIRAAKRSPSLKYFISRISELLHIDTTEFQKASTPNLDLQIVSNLLKELFNGDTIVYQTVNGQKFSAKELQASIALGDPIGKDYASDLLRVARDFLKRKANRCLSLH